MPSEDPHDDVLDSSRCPVCGAGIDDTEVLDYDYLIGVKVVVARCQCIVCGSRWCDHYVFNGTRTISRERDQEVG